MELTGAGLVLRTYREGDAPRLFEAVRESIAEVSPWLSWCHQNYSIEDSREFVASRDAAAQGDEHYSFAVFAEDEPDRLLGGVGLNFINRVHQIANLGYWVRTSAAGKGIATRGTRLTARFAFEQLGFHRVEIVAAVNNVASQRVAERAGALREAVLRKRLLIRGESVDAVMFSLVREDLSSGTDFSL
ncbi:MAG TPA: GNAT family protein [Pyrinomonadaceae bacterium]|nr:GNAT family protein [Pyrinomonadaceae bacterium]